MSGGSFGYLCFTDNEAEAIDRGEDLQRMVEVLTEKAPDHPVTDYTKRLAGGVADIPRAVTDVWMAVEWWRSGDWGEDAVDRALALCKDYTFAPVRPDHKRLMGMEARLHELLAEYEGSGILSATRVRKAMAGG